MPPSPLPIGRNCSRPLFRDDVVSQQSNVENQPCSVHVVQQFPTIWTIDYKYNSQVSTTQAPLHLSAQWGQEEVVTNLIEHGADINKQDAEGKHKEHIVASANHLCQVTSWIARNRNRRCSKLLLI